MKRRAFLKVLGAVGVAACGVLPELGLASHRTYAPPLENTPEALRLAIEALFPKGVQHSRKAYEEYLPGFGQALQPSADHLSWGIHVQRVVHAMYGLAYRHTGDEERDARLRGHLYRGMYNTAFSLADNPANRDAILVWRWAPVEFTGRESEFEKDEPGPMITRLNMRLGLRQTGWRERLMVSPAIAGDKPQGQRTPMVSDA